jgi:hypothetical protein
VSRFSAFIDATRAVKGAAAIAAFACGVALATPGQATQYFLQSATMNTSRTAHINGPGGFHDYVYLGPIQFKAYEGTNASGPSADFLGFCVDIFHDIGLGTLNLKYDDAYDLTTNSKYLTSTPFAGGTALTQGQITQVGRLVNYGTALFEQAPSTTDRTNRLAGLQGAIWQVINPGYTVTSGTAAVNGYIASYSGANYLSSLTGYGPISSDINFITETGKYGTSRAHQSFAFAGAVPEPSTWAMLIAGFGFAGAALRRARYQPVRVRL